MIGAVRRALTPMALAAAAALAPAAASAHQAGVSYSELTIAGSAVDGRLRVAIAAHRRLDRLRRGREPLGAPPRRGRERARRRRRRRWAVAFAFGLVHGVGFASVLRELHLPRGGLAASLVAFNLGVETGQIAIVAVAFPLLALARRSVGFVPHGVRAGSLAIGCLGLFWLVQRAAWP